MQLRPSFVRFGVATVVAGLAFACAEGPSAPGNRAPTVVLSSPGLASTFAGGDSLDVVILATDQDEGVLSGASVTWWVDLHHHAEHVHPFHPATEGTVGRFGVERAGFDDADVFLRVYARVVDAQGIADTAFVDVSPRLTTFTVTSDPVGLQVTLDGLPHTTPYSEDAIVGTLRMVGAAAEQAKGSVIYALGGWSDAGTATHQVTLPSSALSLSASYDSIATTNARPSVAFTAPAPDAVTAVGAPVLLSVSATDSDGGVVSVEYRTNGVLVASSSAAPFGATWVPGSAGEFQLVAIATDDGGAVGESAPRRVTVQAAGSPTVVLDSPLEGTLGLVGAVALSASASDETGVSYVEFEVDGAPLAADSSAPYNATLPSTADYASGAHVLRARARDADGNYSTWATARVTFGGVVTLPAGFTRTTVASGLGAIPTAVAVAPDGRLFISEQTGAMRVLKAGVLLAQPFVTLEVNAEGERGLLGVAFDPDFVTNGWVYVYYTTPAGGAHNRISRLTAIGDVAQSGSEVVLVEFPGLSTSRKHNGGAMKFGPDGMLYVAVGEHGSPPNASSLSVPFGKMLRFAKDGTIPGDNPFYGVTTGLSRAIWAIGLRNPFTFDIDPSTGRMHINDVGQSEWEEINVGRPGADFGWPSAEGVALNTGYDSPLLAYRHADSPTLFSGLAVVGAAFYTPSTPLFGAEYVGDYFFGDYVRGWIYRLDAGAQWAPYAFAQMDASVTGLAVTPEGSLYVLVGTRIDRISR